MRKNIIGIFVCMLLIATALPAVGTINKTVDERTAGPFFHIDTPIRTLEQSFFQGNCIVWDNHVANATIGIHAQDDPPEMSDQWDSFGADDFQFDVETAVHWIYWLMGYYGCNFAEGPKDYHFDWNITFYTDDGTGNRPSAVYAGPFTIADADIYKGEELQNDTSGMGYWMCSFGAVLSEPVMFSPGIKYWISIYGIGSHYPQSAWFVHDENAGGILLHEGVLKSDHWGYPEWTNISDFYEPVDMNFLLGGEILPLEITLKKGLGIIATIKNLFPEPYTQTNITVTFSVTGGFVLNRTKTFFIEELNVNTTETAKFYPIGFGRIIIEVNAISRTGAPGRANTSGFLILFFVI